jgi:hypothetical protein
MTATAGPMTPVAFIRTASRFLQAPALHGLHGPFRFGLAIVFVDVQSELFLIKIKKFIQDRSFFFFNSARNIRLLYAVPVIFRWPGQENLSLAKGRVPQVTVAPMV